MGREHAPRPGVTWQQQPAVVEVVVSDGDEAQPVGLSREQRRALKRAQRRKGSKR